MEVKKDNGSPDIGATVQLLQQLLASIQRAQDVVRNHCAFFAVEPLEASVPNELTETARTLLCTLDSSHPGNRTILGYQAKLDEAKQTADIHTGSTNRKIARLADNVTRKVEQERISLLEELYNVWLKQRRHKQSDNAYDSCGYHYDLK